ncbi:MAG: signal peptide peptidase SppA [Bacteroidales bacterium]|nr:signal peptide peptidase SppA [Bacteroidales bacterium]
METGNRTAPAKEGCMKRFLITLAAVLVGGFLLLILPILVIAGKMSGEEANIVEENSILTLDLSESIVNFKSGDKSALSNKMMGKGSETSVYDIKEALEKAAEDPNIAMLALEGTAVGASTTEMAELRRAILDFKAKSGKPVYYYGNTLSTGIMYVATAGDSLFVTPEGGVSLIGLTTSRLYFAGLAEKLGIDVDVVKHGKYKSAVEQYTRKSISDEDREQTETYVNTIWSELRDTIAKGRGVSPEAIDAFVDNLKWIEHAKTAKEEGLVDGLMYYDEYKSLLASKVGVEEKDLKTISVNKYRNSLGFKGDEKEAKDKIAIVFAEGQIKDGNESSASGTIYGDDLSATLREIRKDEDIKGVVFRVNSPGGSALASDIIWREVELMKKEKPIVVSMGTYAASGGYYISCASDYIYAENSTLTGSIGVFGILPNGRKAAEKVGVGISIVSSNKNAAVIGMQDLTEEQKKALQGSIDDTYDTFLTRVANGRKMTKEQVDSIAQGRVWAGGDAIKIGLVDAIGGLDDAIAKVVEMASLEEYETEIYPEKDDSPMAMIMEMMQEARVSILSKLLGVEVEKAAEKVDEASEIMSSRMPKVYMLSDKIEVKM